MADQYKTTTYKHIGIGGAKCPCCNRFIKNKKALRRLARRAMRKINPSEE